MTQVASHEGWKRGFRAAASQKTFKVLDPDGKDDQVHEIDISTMANEAGGGDSAAEKTGWIVDVRYANAPDMVLFTNTFPNEELANKVMDDLARAAAEVEGFIRRADFEGAKTAMQELNKLFKSSTAEPPVSVSDGVS